MLLADLVATSDALAATPGRNAKIALLADVLRRLEPDEAAAGVAWLSGDLLERQLGAGWATLRELDGGASEPALTVAEVASAFAAAAELRGPGSQSARRGLLGALFARATPEEAAWLRRLIVGDLRQGALAGVMADAIAAAAGVPKPDVRRALMLQGDLPRVAEIALAEGATGLSAIRLEVGRPLQPMLASPAADLDAALAKAGPAAVEWKLDGARIQVHRSDGDVAVFTRSLDDVTPRLPEVVDAALALDVRQAVLDGEAIALRADGRPHPFQVTGSRFASKNRGDVPLTPFLFDVLHLDGEDLLDRPGAERFEALRAAVPERLRVPQATADSVDRARTVFDDALAHGHEGVMVKALDAPYEAGRRGAGWLKVKPVHTLDLVVLAVEWGHGRRRGKLSNLWLGTREGVMLGKTFKGLTDEMLAWQTERLLELATERDGHVVHVRPELVVEIAFDGVQASPRYPGGVALRFARVVRHRPDKPAAEADTLESVLALHSGVT